jgi:hypothetical protein
MVTMRKGARQLASAGARTVTLIEDFRLIGDLHSAALVGRDGAVAWLCLPQFDSASCFSALLGDEQHGRWLLAPVGEVRASSRRYRPGTPWPTGLASPPDPMHSVRPPVCLSVPRTELPARGSRRSRARVNGSRLLGISPMRRPRPSRIRTRRCRAPRLGGETGADAADIRGPIRTR